MVAGVSVRDVHRIIDEHILPDSFFVTQDARSFKSQACVFISFYFGAADRLTSEERQRTIALAIRGSRYWTASTKIVQDGFLAVDFAPFWNGVDERLLRLRAARALVSADDEILNGTPVIRGTRVPVFYDVAASVGAGIAMGANSLLLIPASIGNKWNSPRCSRKRIPNAADPGSALFRLLEPRSSRLAASSDPLQSDEAPH